MVRPLQKIAYVLVTCGLLVCLLLTFERPAYAYVDPGSGLFLIQGVSSTFLGVLYVIRRKLKLTKGKKKPSSSEVSKSVGGAEVVAQSEADVVDRVA